MQNCLMEETPSFSPDSLKKLSLLLLVGAILLAVIPVSSYGHNCGTLIGGITDLSYAGMGTDVATQACTEALKTRRIITFAVAGIGIVLLVAGSISPAYSSKGIKNSSEGLEGENNFCSQCGKQLDPEAQFCSTCGKQL